MNQSNDSLNDTQKQMIYDILHKKMNEQLKIVEKKEQKRINRMKIGVITSILISVVVIVMKGLSLW